MSFKCDEFGHVCVIAISGDFVAPQAQRVLKWIEESLVARRAVNFIVDLEGSRFISSDALEALLAARRECEQRRGQVILAGLDENLRKILQITRLDRHFDCQPDVAAALKATSC